MYLFILKAVGFLIGFLHLSLGRLLGRLLFYTDKRHREIAVKNLEMALCKEKDISEIHGIAKKVFENLGMNLIEFCHIPRLTQNNIDNYVSIKGIDNFLSAYKKDKGVILLSAHLGNWEMSAVGLALKGYPIHIVVREPDNPVISRFINYVRTSCGNRTINKVSGMRTLLKILEKGNVVATMLDQNVTWTEAVFVDFFGRLAATNKGVALLAMKSNAPVIPIFIVRKDNNGRHEIVFDKEIPVETSGDKKNDILVNTARFVSAIEDAIRKEPEQWFWVHQRWKSRPENDPRKGRRSEALKSRLPISCG